MSGIIGSKLNVRGSGHVAKLGTDGQVLTSAGLGKSAIYEDAAGGGLDWQTIVTGSTMTAVAGEGYWINTTSNTCTITLPSSASNGDEIMFVDYARNWGTNKIIIDSNGLNYQSDDDSFTVEYETDGTALRIVYSGATNGWIPTLDKTVEDVPAVPPNENGIFGFGNDGSGGYMSTTNLVSSVGVVGSNVTGVGTIRSSGGACEFGDDKGIFAYGSPSYVSMSNLVSNAGVVASDVTGVGTGRADTAACSYGEDKGIFAYGYNGSRLSMSNLVSNVGVIGSDVTGVGTARYNPGACEYGGDKGIFGYGQGGAKLSLTNLVSNVGVVGTDVTGVGTAKNGIAACSYGADKGIFAFGLDDSAKSATSNLISNTGVQGSDVSAVGTARDLLAATQYGGDKGIFGFGTTGSQVSMTNLVSNAGVVASDVTGVGTARQGPAGCSYN